MRFLCVFFFAAAASALRAAGAGTLPGARATDTGAALGVLPRPSAPNPPLTPTLDHAAACCSDPTPPHTHQQYNPEDSSGDDAPSLSSAPSGAAMHPASPAGGGGGSGVRSTHQKVRYHCQHNILPPYSISPSPAPQAPLLLPLNAHAHSSTQKTAQVMKLPVMRLPRPPPGVFLKSLLRPMRPLPFTQFCSSTPSLRRPFCARWRAGMASGRMS